MKRKRKQINLDVGRRIRKYRERANMTREELAEAVDISPRFVADLERGSVEPSLATLTKIRDLSSIASRLASVNDKYLTVLDEILFRQMELIKLAEAADITGKQDKR